MSEGTASRKIGIVMGSDSDIETMKETVKVLKEFKVGFDVDVISCHRAPQLAYQYAQSAEKKGYEIIIAGAGGAAALPGVLASLTTLPVIGVPIIRETFGGQDALYSMLQMPAGVPVAIAGIGNVGARNAGVLAVEILSLKDPSLRKKLHDYKERLVQEVRDGAKKVERELGKIDH
jgi:5-(carboxyamino)imidazole ribonucleotide mutase